MPLFFVRLFNRDSIVWPGLSSHTSLWSKFTRKMDGTRLPKQTVNVSFHYRSKNHSSFNYQNCQSKQATQNILFLCIRIYDNTATTDLVHISTNINYCCRYITRRRFAVICCLESSPTIKRHFASTDITKITKYLCHHNFFYPPS